MYMKKITQDLTREQLEDFKNITDDRKGKAIKIFSHSEALSYGLFFFVLNGMDSVLINPAHTQILSNWFEKNLNCTLLEFIEAALIHKKNSTDSSYRPEKSQYFIREQVLEFFIENLKSKNSTYQMGEELLDIIYNGPIESKYMGSKYFKSYLEVCLNVDDDVLSAKMTDKILKNNYDSMEFVKREKIRPVITKRFKNFDTNDFEYIRKIINNHVKEVSAEKDFFELRDVTSIKVSIDYDMLTRKHKVSQSRIDGLMNQVRPYLLEKKRENPEFLSQLGIHDVPSFKPDNIEFEYFVDQKILVKEIIGHILKVFDESVAQNRPIKETNLAQDLTRIAMAFNLEKTLDEEPYESSKKQSRRKI